MRKTVVLMGSSLRTEEGPALVVMTDGDAAALRLLDHNVERNWPGASFRPPEGRPSSVPPLGPDFLLETNKQDDLTSPGWCGAIGRRWTSSRVRLGSGDCS